MRLFTNPQHKNWMRKQPKRMSSSAMILENAAGELLVVKAFYKDYWTLPGGIIDKHETPKQAAIRETHEEVGVKIEPSGVSFVAVVDRMSSEAQTYQFIFKAGRTVSAEEIILGKSEIDDYTFISRDQARAPDRTYAKAVLTWAQDITGYIEETFEKRR